MTKPRVTRERMEKALQYRAETDQEVANLKEQMERAAFKAKKVRAAMFLHSSGTVEARKALAEDSSDYEDAMEDYFVKLGEYLAMTNKRDTEQIVVDVWRSINASMNKGNVV